MPQVQIINREPDQMAQNIQDTGNSLLDNIRKSQALKQTAEYYKILAKNADTETKKFEYERKAKGAEYIASITEKVKDPQLRGLAFKAGQKAGIIDMDILHDVGNEASSFFEQLTQPTKQEQADLAEQQAKTEGMQQNTAFLKTLQDGGQAGAGIMPGTTASVGPQGTTFNMPLNPRLTETEQAIVGGAGNIENYVNEVFSYLDKGVLDYGNEAQKVGLDTGVTYLAGQGDIGLLQSAQQKLKALIPFAKGGKQLTTQEAKRLDTLLNFQGKDEKRIRADLQSFVSEFNNMKNLALGGANAAKFKEGSPGAAVVRQMTGASKKQYVKTGRDSVTGKRVGMLADGTVEEIQ